MPKRAEPLTELKIRRAAPKSAPYYLPDGNGLRLDVSPLGTKTWTVRYKLPGASHHAAATLGRYPDMSLAQARAVAAEAQQRARQGIPTAGMRKAQRLVVAAQTAQREAEAQSDAESQRATFRAVADRWLAEKRPTWSDSTYRKASLVVRDYFNPVLGDADARTIETKDVRPVLLSMAASVPALARKARQYATQIVEHAISEGLRGDTSALRLQRVLPTVRGGHMPAVTEDEAKLGEIMRAIYGYGGAVARAALILTATTAVRPGMAACARWSEINMKTAEWRIPAERMKMREPFTTSIPRQALQALEDLQKAFGKREFVFPSPTGRVPTHINRDALSKALRDMGYQGEHSAHGFRAAFRSLGRERLNADVDVLEAQLAHAPKGETQAAYARATFKEKRRELVQRWADYLDELRERGSNIVPIRRAG